MAGVVEFRDLLARLEREVGVCLATSGPGAIHLLNGLYDVRLDSTPVLAIVGQQATTALGSSFQQEVDLAMPSAGERALTPSSRCRTRASRGRRTACARAAPRRRPRG
ncbi:thiamine pyrophosphate-binding protein [Thiohalocapsa sp. ML1]|uniref:thiamine pyrophosphate-binding protein n=1 Tax=Thiohalocapsa sp. ML1 TaxID=1431688 RepID=UPI0020B17296|nr:thiamine pyrophosphate-binding protein [Thiohalocapsa sp. ML1]